MNKNRGIVSSKKSDYSSEYRKLNLQKEFLEKSFADKIKSLRIDADLVSQIGNDRIKASNQRQPTMQEEMEATVEIFKELKRLKLLLQDAAEPSLIQNLDVGDFRLRLTKLSDKIEAFKRDKTGFENLKTEEEMLNSDLREFEKLILTKKITKTVSIKNPNEQQFRSRSEANDLFTELVARTGHTQGWTDEDHSLFLKMKNKFDSVPKLVIELRKKRPHLTNEEIVNHEAWYKFYTELRDKRKKEIAEWRSKNKLKETAKIKTISVKTNETKNGVCDAADKTASSLETDKINEVTEIQDKKKMIDEWKAEKARRLAMDEEQKRRLEKAKLDEEKRRRDTKRSEFRMKLKDYRENKANNLNRGQSKSLSRINYSKDEKQWSCDSLRLIKSFREQDERCVKKRLSRIKLSARNNNNINDQSLNKLSVKYERRVNSTLFLPTKVWEEKCKREIKYAENAEFGKINYVKDIQRLSGAGLKNEIR